jgi:ABC-type uncharacterized transport system substrate-binding protein
MNRREFMTATAVGVLTMLSAAHAQTRPVIGFMNPRRSPEEAAAFLASFKQGLADGGLAEGRDVAIEYRWARGDYDRLPTLAAELAARRVNVIVAGGDAAAAAAQHATTAIPIVFVIGGDPVQQGLAESFNRPGRNATGVTLLAAEIEAKRLGILRELLPDAAVTGVLVNPGSPLARGQQDDLRAAANAAGQRLLIAKASTDADLDAAFAWFEREGVASLLVVADPYFHMSQSRIVTIAAAKRLPAMYDIREYPAGGGLMSYGVSLAGGYRQVGAYTAKILKGASPATLPVLQPTTFELVINLKAAKTLDLAIPPSLLARADEVIE